jgi:hypothetical protein
MLCAPAGIVEDIKFTQFILYDTGRWTFLDEKEEFVPRLLMWVASSCSRSDWQLEKPGAMGLELLIFDHFPGTFFDDASCLLCWI